MRPKRVFEASLVPEARLELAGFASLILGITGNLRTGTHLYVFTRWT